MTGPVLSTRDLTRTFPTAAGEVVGCRAVTVDVHPGDLVILRGRSGAGKTTLLNLLGGLDRPSSGQVLLQGRDLATLPEADLLAVRREQLGFVFQSFGLLPMLSAQENVEVPLRIQRLAPAERDRRVADALDAVGLSDHARQRPAELSGGQQQRVGLARALVARPRILIADEPTAQLDSVTASTIIDLVAALVADRQIAAVVSTHQAGTAARGTRLWNIHDGVVTEAGPGGDVGR